MGRVAAAMLVMMAAMGCGPDLPAICSAPGDRPVVTHGRHIEVCGSCDDDGCAVFCADYCDAYGNVEGYENPFREVTCEDMGAESFCGRWVAD